MPFSEETLMAYADNELDAETRAAVEAAIATDPEVAKKVAQHQALRHRLKLEFDPVLEEPTPQRLLDAAHGAPAVRREGNVIPLRRKSPPRRAWPQWASLAASLIVGVLIGRALLGTPSTESPITSRDGQLTAHGVLAHALSEQLSSQPANNTPVHIGLTFKSKSGDYCRTFTLHQTITLAGLACHSHDDWDVRVLAQTLATPPTDNYRQASSDIPKSVMQAVDDTISGDALDAHAETAARDKNWTP